MRGCDHQKIKIYILKGRMSAFTEYIVYGETTVEILYLWNANSNTRKIDMPNHPPMHRLNSKIQLIEKSKIIIVYPVQTHL